jgi:hypothetical protein
MESKTLIKMRKCQLLILLFIIPLTSIIVGLQAKPILAYEATVTLGWGEGIYFKHNITETVGRDIKWSFKGSHSEVGINVGVADESTLNLFEITMDVDYVLSDGLKTKDSGRFNIPQDDKWFIIFYVLDMDGFVYSTTVDVKAEYVDSINLGLVLGLGLGIPIGLVVIILPIIVFTVILPRRKKKRLVFDQQESSKIKPSYAKAEMIYCWKCGSENPKTNKYCGQCSAELATKK